MGTAVVVSTYVLALVVGALAWRRGGSEAVRAGLRRAPALPHLALGLGIGSVAVLAALLAVWTTGSVRSARLDPDPGRLVAVVAVIAVLAAVEELAMRGILLPSLGALLHRPALAVALVALVSALSHVARPGADALTTASAALGGVMYGLAYVVSGGIWLPVGLHVAWNAVQGPVLGLPLSGGVADGALARIDLGGADLVTGGDYGLEGGLVGLGARLLVVALVLLAFRTTR